MKTNTNQEVLKLAAAILKDQSPHKISAVQTPTGVLVLIEGLDATHKQQQLTLGLQMLAASVEVDI